MAIDNWIKEENLTEFQKTISRRWFLIAIYLILAVLIGYSLVVNQEPANPFKIFSLSTLGFLLIVFSFYLSCKTLIYREHIDYLVERQDNHLKEEAEYMMTQIELKLGESDVK